MARTNLTESQVRRPGAVSLKAKLDEHDSALDALEVDAATTSITALSVVGRKSDSNGVLEEITAASDNQVLVRNGTALEFGQVAEDGIADEAVSPAKLSADTLGLLVQAVTQQITHADLTDADTSQAIDVGDPLPTGAIVLGHEVKLDTQFTGGSVSALKMDLGGTNTVAICNQFNVKSATAGGKRHSPGYNHVTSHGDHMTGSFSEEQLVATFASTGDNVDALTAGDLTITVWYVVLA